MSTEKCPALPQNRLCPEMLLPLDQKTPFAMNPLKAGVLVGGGAAQHLPQWHENTLFSFLQSSVQASSVCVQVDGKNNHISLPAKSSTVHCLKDSM